MTASALSSLLEEVHKHGDAGLYQRKHIKEATEKELSRYDEYGDLFVEVPLFGSANCTAYIVNLHALFFAAFAQGGGFYKLLLETMTRHPPSMSNAYDLVLYSDEVVPGNALSHDNRRKIWMVYASVLQFGAQALSQEFAWLTLSCCRSTFLSQVHGGIGQLMKCLVKNIFQNDKCDVQRAGIVLRAPNGSLHRIWIKLGCFVQDGAAHKSVWGIKGDAGTRCCMLCKNVISKRSGLTNEEAGEILVTENVPEEMLQLTTNDDIWKSVSKLESNANSMSLIMCLASLYVLLNFFSGNIC